MHFSPKENHFAEKSLDDWAIFRRSDVNLMHFDCVPLVIRYTVVAIFR